MHKYINMNRDTFSSLLVKQRENKNIGKNELCRMTGFTFLQLQRIENASNNFNMSLVFRYLDSVGASLSLCNDRHSYMLQEYGEYAQWLTNAREGLYSFRKLAEAANCSFSAIVNVERGKTVISIDSFLKLADTLGYTIKIEPK